VTPEAAAAPLTPQPAAAPLTPEAAAARATPTPTPVAELQTAALAWYEVNGRNLAFRRTTDPWAVLVSEVMAQQTQAARAAGAWVAFIERYPAPAALASASNADVIRAWRGLGYNRRALALRATAIRVVEDHDGRVPGTLVALESLPGIGPYTARAVLAIAFGRPVAALDTNISRVLDRAVGPLPAGARARQVAADGFVPADRPAAWTHALMDIGATICRKRSPRCADCPLAAKCRSATATAARPTSTSLPARSASPVRFELTSRWLRGQILDRLRQARADQWVILDEPIGEHSRGRVAAAVAALEREGFLERHPANPRAARLHD
jgi:A/G-specific adenine glycosylase